MKINYFDTHSHIQEKEFDSDREKVIQRMRDAKVGTFVVGVDYLSSKRAVEIAEAHPNIYAIVGIHPTDNKTERFDTEAYAKLVENKKVVGIGECGLQYFRVKEHELKEEKKRQRKIFHEQIEFAHNSNLPLMLHCRPSEGTMDSYEDVLEELQGYDGLRGNVHFFVGNIAIAERFIARGFTLSFTGVITFTGDYDEVIRSIPLDMILSETDCPYVTPVPYRGERNEPIRVIEVVKRIAEIRGEDLKKVKETLISNAMRVFDVE